MNTFFPDCSTFLRDFGPLIRIPHVCFALFPTAVFGGYHFGPSWTLTARFHQVFRFLVLLRQYSLINLPLSNPNVCLSLCRGGLMGSHGTKSIFSNSAQRYFIIFYLYITATRLGYD